MMPVLHAARLCATGALTLPRQRRRRRRWSWAQIAEFVTGVGVLGVAFVAGWGLGIPS